MAKAKKNIYPHNFAQVYASTRNQCYDKAECHRWQPENAFQQLANDKSLSRSKYDANLQTFPQTLHNGFGGHGVFDLNDDYYAKSGGILTPSPHYEAMFKPNS